jgi:hypothetical protein
MKWKSAFEDEPQQQLFTMPLYYTKFDNVKRMTVEQFIGYTLTGSFLASLTEDSRITISNQLRQIIVNHVQNVDKDTELHIPFVTDLYWCTARKE